MLIRAADSVLIVIDIQERLVPAMQAPARTVRNTRLLLEAAAECGAQVIVAQGAEAGGHGERRGTITLVQEIDGAEAATTITAGEYAINPPGVWHTANVAEGDQPQVLFITAGEGTEHRPR